MVAGTLTYDTKMDTKGLQKGVSSVKSIVAGLGITKIISSAFNVLTGSIDGAINRIDALNNFPNVMANLGIGAEESREAIEDLSKRLQGIPTTLDDASIAVQRFTSKNGDVKKSVEIFDAVNNAILAGGANSQIQASALEQLSQAYAKGKPDMMEWRTLQMAMPAQLKQVAKAMGKTTDELGDGLRKGKISMDDFIETIIKLNKEGSGEFKAFSEQARNSTGGIRTSITNAKTAVVRGVAGIVTAINETMINAGFGSIAENFSKIGKWAEQGLKFVSDKIKEYAPIIINKVTEIVQRVRDWIQKVNLKQTIKNVWEIIKNFAKQVVNGIKPIYNFIKNNIIPIITKMFQVFSKDKLDTKSFEKFNKVLKDLQPVIVGVVVAMLTMKGITAVATAIKAVQTAFVAFTTFLKTMTMPTFGSLISIIAGVVAMIAMFAIRSKEDFKGAEEGLKNSVSVMSNSFREYGDAINNAEGYLKGFNTSLFATESEQQKLEEDMRSIQSDITAITSLASKERRSLTDAEIQKLEEYFDKLKEVRDKQIGIYQSMQESITAQAETEAKRLIESGESVEESSKKWIATAKANAENIKTIAEESATAEIANLNSIYDTQQKRETEEYKNLYNEIIARKEARINNANEEVSKVTELYKNQYSTQIQGEKDSLNEFLSASRERQLAQDELSALEEKQAKKRSNFITAGLGQEIDYTKKSNELKDEIARADQKITQTLDDETKKRIGIYAQQIITNQEANGKLTESDIELAQTIIEAYGYMNGESQTEMKDMVDGLKTILENANLPLTNAGEEITNSLGNAIKKVVPIAKSSGQEFGDGIKNEIDNKKPSIRESALSVKDDAMVGPFAGIKNDGETAGSDFGQGILNGLNNKSGVIKGAALAIGAMMDSATRSGMDAHSPSKKAYRTGLDYIAGLRNAIKDGEKDVYSVTEDLGDTMITELSKAVNIESGKTMAKATLNSNVNKSFVFNASFNGNVELDNKKVGRILAPNVSKALKVGGL